MPDDIRILGPDGSPIRKQDLTREILPPTLAGVRNAWHGSIAGGLTPDRLAAILLSAANGEAYDYLTLAEDMEERDPHYASVLGTRKRALEGLDHSVESPTDDSDDINRTDAVRELVQRDAFGSLVGDLSDALGKGYSAVELGWQTGKMWWPQRYTWRDPRFFRVDRVTGARLLMLTDEHIDGEPVPPYKFIVHIPRLKSGLPLRGGIARLVAVANMLKSYTMTDWMAFAEVFGMPFRVGKYGPNPKKEDLDILRMAVANLGSDAAAVIPDSMLIEFHDAGKSAGGQELFYRLAEYLDKQVSKAVLGQTMTTDDGSSLSQAKVHNDVRMDILAADAKALEATINRDLVRPFIDLNFGPQEVYPRFRLIVPEPEDLAQLTDSLAKLVPLGLKVEQSVIRDKLNLPDPEDDADLLVSPLQAALPPPDAARNHHQSMGHHAGCGCHALNAGADSDLIDDLVDDALNDWEPIMEPMLRPIIAAVNAATSFDDLRQRLASVYPDMDVEALVNSLAKNSFIARGLGDVSDAV